MINCLASATINLFTFNLLCCALVVWWKRCLHSQQIREEEEFSRPTYQNPPAATCSNIVRQVADNTIYCISIKARERQDEKTVFLLTGNQVVQPPASILYMRVNEGRRSRGHTSSAVSWQCRKARNRLYTVQKRGIPTQGLIFIVIRKKSVRIQTVYRICCELKNDWIK